MLLALLIAGCGGGKDDTRVEAADYRAYYLWSGVEPPPAMSQAKVAYLLWGELRRGDPARIAVLRRTRPRAAPDELWLVVRAERLDWGEGAFRQLAEAARVWNRDGALTGVQVDFDSSTGGLGDYARFLADLRRQLPPGLRLSATGLMDWPANASEKDLARLRNALDEIVIQTYRGTETIPDYRRYLAMTNRLAMPYRVALVEGGEWQAPSQLSKDRHFRGYVVFLLAAGAGQKP